MKRSDPEHKHFKKEFWIWFDKLPASQKKRFWYFKYDIAETNFYFTVWEKMKEKEQNGL